MAEVQAAMDAGIEPADPKVQDMARRWVGLVNEFTGGDPGIFKSLSSMYANEDNVRGMNVPQMREMMAYIQKAMAAAGIKFAGQ
jgi:hypothetical protein